MSETGSEPIDFEDWGPEHKVPDAEPVEDPARLKYLRRITSQPVETKPTEPPELK